MKISPMHFFLSVVALVATASVQAGPPSDSAPLESLKLVRYVEPAFPASLRFESTREGYAEIVLLVAPNGRLADSFVIAYSHPAFADTVSAAIAKWEFEPNADAGKNAPSRRICLRFNFLREGLIVGFNVTKDYLDTVRNFGDGSDEVRVCKLRDLDRIPDTVSFVVPIISDNMRRQSAKGNAVVYFYIDEDGRVRVPAVLEASDSELASAALAAVTQWKFAPPSRRGHSTRVLAVQEFIFNPGSPFEVKGS